MGSRICLWSALLVFAASTAAAQDRVVDNNANGWYNYFGDHPIAGNWGIHLEGQYRRSDVITRWQQLLLRPGVNYQPNKLLMLTVGYGFIRSYPYGDYPAARRTDEHRIFEQAWLRYATGRIGWTTRLRFENRFLDSLDSSTGKSYFRYENRFRAWQQIRVPVTGRTYLTAYDELFFYVKPYDSSSVIDQNRAYAAYGIRFKKFWSLEMGYMNQSLLQRSGDVRESNHTLMISLFSVAPLRGH